MAKMKMIPGGRADRAVKAVGRTVRNAAIGATAGYLYSKGMMIDPATPAPMLADMMKDLPNTATAMKDGATLGALAEPVVRGLKHVMNPTQFKN
jgi:hypothetical protein